MKANMRVSIQSEVLSSQRSKKNSGNLDLKQTLKAQPTMHAHFHHLKWGVFYILLAWLAFTIMIALSRLAKEAAPLPMIIFAQNFISWLAVLPWFTQHGWGLIRTQRLGLLALRGLTGFFGFSLLFMAAQRIPLVDTMLLNNTAPLLLPFVIWIWLKKPIPHKAWPGIFAGFLGVILVLRPGLELFNLGALFGLGAAVSLSISMVAGRILSYTERSHTVLFYFFLIASLCSLPAALYVWKPVAPLQYIEMLCIGLLSFFGQWAFVRAFHHAKASVLGPFCYVSVVYAAMIDWAFWGNVPDLIAWIGIFCICLGGVWTIRFTSKLPVNK